MSSLYDDVLHHINNPTYDFSSLLLQSILHFLFKNYNTYQIANLLVACVINFLPIITKSLGAELFEDETSLLPVQLPSELPIPQNKLDDANCQFNFMFSNYKKEGDAIINATPQKESKLIAIINSNHFGLDEKNILNSCSAYMKHSSVNELDLVTCNKNVFNGSQLKNYCNITDPKKKSNHKTSLGKLLFGFELLAFNYGYLNFKSVLHHIMLVFEDEFIDAFNTFNEKEKVFKKIKFESENTRVVELDQYVQMYLNKTESARPVIDNSNTIPDLNENQDSNDDFTEFNTGITIIKPTPKQVPPILNKEIPETQSTTETQSKLSSTNKRKFIDISHSQDNQSQEDDEDRNNWIDIDEEEEVFNTEQNEREKEQNNNDTTQNLKKPRQEDFYITKNMIKDSYGKLESLMSLENYGDFRKITKCNTISKSSLSKADSVLNLKTILDFDIRVSLEENIVLANILHVVKESIRYHVKWVSLMNADKNLRTHLLKEDKDLLTKKFIYLLNLDGANGLVTFALQLSNSKAFGNPKSRDNVFPIAAWKGGEEQLRSIADGIKFMIEAMRENGVEIDGVIYHVDFWVTTDLLSLMKISRLLFKQMCPYCITMSTICDRRHQLRLAKELGCILSIPPSKVIICLLHMKERIVERLLIDAIMLLSSNRSLIRILRSFEHMQKFALREISTKKGVLFRCYLTGNMVKSIFKNLKSLRGNICNSQYCLLSLFRSISLLLDNSKPLNNSQQDRLTKLLSKMEKLYCTVYTTKPKSWYLHILFHHVPDLLRLYQTIKPYETQGFEGAHIDDQEFMVHTSHNGGKHCYLDRLFPGFKDKMLIQFLIPRLKKLMLCNHFGMKFHLVERKTKAYINFLNQPYPPYSDIPCEQLVHVSLTDPIQCTGTCTQNISITVSSEYNPSQNNSNGTIISLSNEATDEAFELSSTFDD